MSGTLVLLALAAASGLRAQASDLRPQASDLRPQASCPLPVPVPTSAGGIGPASADEAVSTPAAGPARPDRSPAPAWDLRCIELFATPRGGAARGVVTLSRPPSPFGVSVTPEGRHLWRLDARVEGLPDPAILGPYSTYVAWATPLVLDPVVRLGMVGNGESGLGTVAFSKFLVMVTAEASADATERSGPLVLRGRSPSARMEAHDMLAQAPSAEQGVRTGAAGGHRHGSGDGWTMPPAYPGVPMLPGVMALRPDVSPLVLEVPGALDPPDVRPREVVTLPDGGTLDLTAGFVRKWVAGRDLVMLAFNGQHPGPLIRVAAGTTIFVNFLNETPFPTAVHWHGIRLDNRFDGVPGVTQDPVQPGESFRYTIRFPDAGIYWYHPHHREDVQQELGLYGNLLVEPLTPDAYGPVNREEVVMLDDLLLDDEGVVPFGREAANFALMGRFGNVFLVNGEPEYRLEVGRGEVVRFFFTNASNTRTFNLSFRVTGEGEGSGGMGVSSPPGSEGSASRDGAATGAPGAASAASGSGASPPQASAGDEPLPRKIAAGDEPLSLKIAAGDEPLSLKIAAGDEPLSPQTAAGDEPLPLKIVATDVGRFERESMAGSVVIAPAERYVVDVRFPEAGTYALVNQVQGVNHRMGVFLEERTGLGWVRVADGPGPEEDLAEAFTTLRVHDDVVAEIDRYRERFDDPVAHEITLALEADSLPLPVEQSMRYDWVYFHPVEWTGTMPMMNWALSADDVRWTIRDVATSAENMDIDWRFRVGDVVKIRVHNDRRSFHAMQHPLHIHGQRFLVLEQDGIVNDNLAWKDTVLLPPGSTTDILLELSNPGRWMVHCHIAEHLESGMKFVFDVEAGS